MRLYEVNFLSYGDYAHAYVIADTEQRAIDMIKSKFDDEDNFSLDNVRQFNLDRECEVAILWA